MVKKIFYAEMPICESEILRYSGTSKSNEEIENILSQVLSEARDGFKYGVCYDEFSVKIDGDIVDFGCFSVKSKALARNLNGCERAIIFAATVGSQIDRLISKYGVISPAKALMLQALGAERIEALCDMFCENMQKAIGKALKPRFSPGYGDVPLEVQKDIFDILNPQKHIGLCLNESLLMSPSKSVTAFVGITSDSPVDKAKINKCRTCYKRDCEFRR